MNYIDIVILVIVLLISYKGFFDGFIHEVSALIGIVAGIFFASRLAGDMAVFFNSHIYNIQSPSISIILGFLIVLAFFWIGILAIGFVVSKFVKSTGLGFLDRILGYLFSCVKVFCLFSFIVYGIVQIKFIQEIDLIKTLPKKSKVYSAMLDTAKIIINFDSKENIIEKLEKLSPEASKQIKDSAQQIQETIPSIINPSK